MRRTAFAIALLLVIASALMSGGQTGAQAARWFKGNTHTHTLNSDGDSAPDEVVRWYREQRYNFLVITDHNFVTPVDGLNALFAAEGRFLAIRGEEVTDAAGDKPVHVCLLGGAGVVRPQGGAQPAEVLQRDIDAIRAAGGIAQVNHPNFGWGVAVGDLQAVKGPHLIEVFNGHPQVNNVGGGGLPGVEAMWDRMLSAGLNVFAVATDDLHELKRPDVRQAAGPGRGWVMVRAAQLTADAILDSLQRGDFYASTGVELTDIKTSAHDVAVVIRQQGTTKYTVQFIGKGGRVLKEAGANPAQYQCVGDEGYVRAKVIDSNGLMAWTQPVRVSATLVRNESEGAKCPDQPRTPPGAHQ